MTLFDHGSGQLRALGRACGYDEHEIAGMLRVFAVAAESWGGRCVEETPRWSGVTDDCSPFEFSLAIEPAGTELRMLAEAQRDPASPDTYWNAGVDLTRRLSDHCNAALDGFERVSDLFRPRAEVYFSMLHGICFGRGDSPSMKVYLNPKAQGLERSGAIVGEALARIGYAGVVENLQSRMRPGDEYQFLCFDLDHVFESRIKIYIRHRRCTFDELHRYVAQVDPGVADDASLLVSALLDGRLPRPPLTMYALNPEFGLLPGCALHVPTFPYAGEDAVIRHRIVSLLSRFGLPTSTYVRCVDALSSGANSDEVGIHNYISIQRRGGSPRVTIYLCPRVYLHRLGAIAFDPQSAWPTPVNSW